MSRTVAKYFSRTKRLLLIGPNWTLTTRVSSRGALASRLNYHGFALRGRRWQRIGDILYSDVVRR